MSENYAYPFDPTGNNPTNLIVGERHTLNPAALRDYNYVILRWAPIYEESLKVKLYPSGQTLERGVDWVGTHKFLDASHSIGRPIIGSFSPKNTTVGIVECEYQTVGGKWTISEEQIIEIISNSLLNPRVATWEQITGVPDIFPVVAHNWRIDDLVGAFELMESIDAIAAALNQQYEDEEYLHALDMDNPHQTTAAQVGAYSSIQIDAILEGFQKRNEAIANSMRLGGLTLAELRTAIYEDGVSNANTIDGRSWDDIVEYVGGATAYNAERFGGRNYSEFITYMGSSFTARHVIEPTTSNATAVTYVRLMRFPTSENGIPFDIPLQFFLSGLPAVVPETFANRNTYSTAAVNLVDSNVQMSHVVAIHDTLKPDYLHVETGSDYVDLWYRIPVGERLPRLTFTFLDERPREYVPGTTPSAQNKTALTVYLGNRALVEYLRNETEQEIATVVDTMTLCFRSFADQIRAIP